MNRFAIVQIICMGGKIKSLDHRMRCPFDEWTDNESLSILIFTIKFCSAMRRIFYRMATLNKQNKYFRDSLKLIFFEGLESEASFELMIHSI